MLALCDYFCSHVAQAETAASHEWPCSIHRHAERLVCVCVCARARVRACVCVCVRLVWYSFSGCSSICFSAPATKRPQLLHMRSPKILFSKAVLCNRSWKCQASPAGSSPLRRMHHACRCSHSPGCLQDSADDTSVGKDGGHMGNERANMPAWGGPEVALCWPSRLHVHCFLCAYAWVPPATHVCWRSSRWPCEIFGGGVLVWWTPHCLTDHSRPRHVLWR